MKILTIVGTRPQFIKMPILSRKFIEHNIQEIIIHSGQHFDKNMSDHFWNNLPSPKYHINLSNTPKHNSLGTMINSISNIIIVENPDYVMVYGDCDTTLAGAISANKLDKKIIHIESGLRSYNKDMPEEVNRVLVDNISEILFCPNENSVVNLRKEGITKNVYIVGDLMIELLRENISFIKNNNKILEEYDLENKNYYLLTIHRKDNTNLHKLNSIFNELGKLNKKIIYPLHPRIKHLIKELNIPPNIIIIEPIDHLSMMSLLYFSHKLITDSGGLQKEAYELRIPCITLRKETEWIETVESGKNILVMNDIYNNIINFNPNNDYKKLYQDNVANNIIQILLTA